MSELGTSAEAKGTTEPGEAGGIEMEIGEIETEGVGDKDSD